MDDSSYSFLSMWKTDERKSNTDWLHFCPSPLLAWECFALQRWSRQWLEKSFLKTKHYAVNLTANGCQVEESHLLFMIIQPIACGKLKPSILFPVLCRSFLSFCIVNRISFAISFQWWFSLFSFHHHRMWCIGVIRGTLFSLDDSSVFRKQMPPVEYICINHVNILEHSKLIFDICSWVSVCKSSAVILRISRIVHQVQLLIFNINSLLCDELPIAWVVFDRF